MKNSLIYVFISILTFVCAGQKTTIISDQPHDVYIQDQITKSISLYLFIHEGTINLASPTVVDTRTFTVEAGHSIAVGDIVCFQDSVHVMQSRVQAVNVNTITIIDLFDYAFPLGGGCAYGTSNLAVNGSVTPQIFKVSPSRLIDGEAWDITRMMLIISDDVAMDDGKFGGITALTFGLMFRITDGYTQNLETYRKNSDMGLNGYDLRYSDKAPAGTYGLSFRKTWNGQDKSGVVLRLNSDTDDTFQAIVQDDLRGLLLLEVKVFGHFVEN